MTELHKSDHEEVLDQETLELLGGSQSRTDVSSERQSRMRAAIMQRIDDENSVASSLYTTIRENDGSWIEVGPLIEKKVLKLDADTGIESYLLRLYPGAAPERHQHDTDELCIVLEGDVAFDDIHLEAGDYHYARKGTWHGQASTKNGALIFLQAGVAAA